ARDRTAAAEELGVRLHAARRTLPVSPAPPPGRAPSGTKPPAPWNQLPTEKMASEPEAPATVELDGLCPEDDGSALVPATIPRLPRALAAPAAGLHVAVHSVAVAEPLPPAQA